MRQLPSCPDCPVTAQARELLRLNGLAKCADGGFQLGGGLIGDVAQSWLVDEPHHNLRIHCLHKNRVVWGIRIGAHQDVAGQQLADLAIHVERAMRQYGLQAPRIT